MTFLLGSPPSLRRPSQYPSRRRGKKGNAGLHIHETLFSIGRLIIGAKFLEGIKVKDIIDPARTYPDQSLTVKTFSEQWLLPE